MKLAAALFLGVLAGFATARYLARREPEWEARYPDEGDDGVQPVDERLMASLADHDRAWVQARSERRAFQSWLDEALTIRCNCPESGTSASCPVHDSYTWTGA